MKEQASIEYIARLAQRAASEPNVAEQRKLIRLLNAKVAKLSAAEKYDMTSADADNGAYWYSRAQRMKRLASQHQSQHVREHLMKIAKDVKHSQNELAMRKKEAGILHGR